MTRPSKHTAVLIATFRRAAPLRCGALRETPAARNANRLARRRERDRAKRQTLREQRDQLRALALREGEGAAKPRAVTAAPTA
jgi:hypothetical protein